MTVNAYKRLSIGFVTERQEVMTSQQNAVPMDVKRMRFTLMLAVIGEIA